MKTIDEFNDDCDKIAATIDIGNLAIAEVRRLKAINAELLEALVNLLKTHEGEGGTKYHAGDIARAAIANATESAA